MTIFSDIAPNDSNDAVLLTYHYQTFLQRLQTLIIYTDIYDIQLHSQNFVRANNNRMVGRSLNTSEGQERLCEEPCEELMTIAFSLTWIKIKKYALTIRGFP